MKTIRLLTCLSLVTLTTTAYAKDNTAKKMNHKMMNAEFVEAKDVQWKDVTEFPGVQMAAIEGDPTKGASHMMMKFKPGFSAPMHHHSANHFVTVVAGTMILTYDGMEHRLPAGSFFSFKNKAKHSTMCAEGAECIISADARGKWDVVPEKKME